MADPHVVTTLRTAIKYNLGLIVEGDTLTRDGKMYTFNTTLNGIGDPPRSPENMRERPFINLAMGPETCANKNGGSHESNGSNEAILENSRDVMFGCWLHDVNDPHLAMEKMLADIQGLFGINYMIPTSGGAATCLNCIYSKSTPYGLDNNTPQVVIVVEYRIWYRQLLTNPAQLG